MVAKEVEKIPQVSPHTRGWTLSRSLVERRHDGFPAHAGMDPRSGGRGVSQNGFPRTRGDGPEAATPYGVALLGFPAHAGMDPDCGGESAWCPWFPRTRGDGPTSNRGDTVQVGVSPHTRGWTRDRDLRGVLAASATSSCA